MRQREITKKRKGETRKSTLALPKASLNIAVFIPLLALVDTVYVFVEYWHVCRDNDDDCGCWVWLVVAVVTVVVVSVAVTEVLQVRELTAWGPAKVFWHMKISK